MPQLRHITAVISLPDPGPQGDDDVYILENLQTLEIVQNLIFTEEVCKRIPNFKELHIYYDCSSLGGSWPSYNLENLRRFNKLEYLSYTCSSNVECAGDSLRNIRFPSSLKELTLTDCELDWSYMVVIASLPNLQFLNFQGDAIAGTEWVFVNEKFLSLKYLLIYECGYVTKWIAHSSNFPVLEELLIWDLPQLDEIPLGIGEITTLRTIYMSGCSESANISTVKILHEQEAFGNLNLRVGIEVEEPELLSEKIEELGLICQNLVI